MRPSEEVVIRVSGSDVARIIDALDSHEYWQLGATLLRRDGFVFVPGDMEPDTVWGNNKPSAAQQDAVAEIGRCRELVDRLRSATSDAPMDT